MNHRGTYRGDYRAADRADGGGAAHTTPRVLADGNPLLAAGRLPEVEALRFFWPRIPTGGIVLLDDYAYYGHDAQGDAMDAVARELGAEIAVLPTGQGLIVKAPPER